MLTNAGIFVELAVSFFAGAGTGLLYFGSLWLTLQRLSAKDSPFLRLAISATIRLGFVIALVIFAILGGAEAWHILSAFFGFLLIRQILIMRAGSRLSTTQRNADS